MNRKTEFLDQCIILDTETTSLDYKVAEIVELGIAKTMYGTNGWDKISTLYKSHTPITPEISSFNNITNKMVKDCPYFDPDDVYSVIRTHHTNNVICVAHNAFFDMKVLENNGFHYNTWLCTMRMTKKLFGEDSELVNFKLPYLRYFFDILDPTEYEVNAHRAGDDALVAAHLLDTYVGIMEELNILNPDSPYDEQILDWLYDPIIFDIMPFGKHKGQKLIDVPMSYWHWAVENMDILNEENENYDRDFAASVDRAISQISG